MKKVISIMLIDALLWGLCIAGGLTFLAVLLKWPVATLATGSFVFWAMDAANRAGER